jgi:ABC-type multidrug transport system fused ATPase/permease subunit
VSATAEEETPFDAYRERVDRPMRRLFATYGPGRLGWFSLGMVANFLARVATLVPPLVLGTAIDAIFLDEGPFTLPVVPDAWLPTEQAAQFDADRAAIEEAARMAETDAFIRDLPDGYDTRVVERGDHETLLAADGRYASLWNVQAGRAEFSSAETD